MFPPFFFSSQRPQVRRSFRPYSMAAHNTWLGSIEVSFGGLNDYNYDLVFFRPPKSQKSLPGIGKSQPNTKIRKIENQTQLSPIFYCCSNDVFWSLDETLGGLND